MQLLYAALKSVDCQAVVQYEAGKLPSNEHRGDKRLCSLLDGEGMSGVWPARMTCRLSNAGHL